MYTSDDYRESNPYWYRNKQKQELERMINDIVEAKKYELYIYAEKLKKELLEVVDSLQITGIKEAIINSLSEELRRPR